MKAVLEFDLPEDEDALRAAIDGIDHFDLVTSILNYNISSYR